MFQGALRKVLGAGDSSTSDERARVDLSGGVTSRCRAWQPG